MDTARNWIDRLTAATRGHAGAAASLLCAVIGTAAQTWTENCRAGDAVGTGGAQEATAVMQVGPIADWLGVRFSSDELRALEAGEVNVERRNCGCYDWPVKHYPYLLVVIRTRRGDLIARPDAYEGVLTFAPLAVKQGEQYCDVSSNYCYGTFSDLCDFTDFRFGRYLAQFFPTCKTNDDEQ